MSPTGQRRVPQRPVAVFALDFEQGAATGTHAHPFGQLVHAAEGLMRVHTRLGSWVVPPGRAVWIPAALDHEVEMVTSVAMRTAYVVAAALPGAPKGPCVIEVTPLLRELILEASRRPRPYPLGGADERLFQVLLDNVSFRDVAPLHLPSPRSTHLQALASRLRSNPADRRTLSAWARATGTSARTLARTFRQETGLSFGAWRAQLRLMHALEFLARGRAVTEVALAVGYGSTSAFIETFRRHLGTTPGEYFSAQRPE